TEQVAVLVAAVANKLAIEVELITTEPDMAQSLASVARGLISLVSFDDSMDDDAIAVLQSTKVEAKGNSLSLSVAIDPSLVVATLRD
ncbi:MAG: putative component of type VI protein secretion system, partial [Woeseiaceae bacterium]